MLPEKNDPRWVTLLKGEPAPQFKFVPAGLMATRIRREYKSNATAAAQQQFVGELHEFFTKYSSVMQDDITAVFGKE